MTQKLSQKSSLKRFYAAVDVQQNADGFYLTLDGKPVHTPAQNMLHCASQQLAQQLADEWRAQREVIHTDTMPFTRLLTIALDRAIHDRVAWLDDILRYAETDLLCYRESPLYLPLEGGRNLVHLQQQHFTPILEWAMRTHDLHFAIAHGVMPVAQPSETLKKLRELFSAASDHELAALAMLTPILGSALLALALWKEAITAEAALEAARLDESWQAQHWGEDSEAVAVWTNKARDARAAAFFLTAN